jgi:hypothetical protein
MSFFKHVGQANNKKVIIVQRTIPGEEHMAAVLYSDILPSRYHDDVMQILESTEGQQSYEFKDILQRRMGSTGDNMLHILSNENYIKRVPQSNVIVKPNSKSSMRLDELVNLLHEVGKGDQAVRKLEEMDTQLGLNSNPSLSNSSRNQAKINASDLSDNKDTMHYTADPVVPANDSSAMMMEMMKTMQAMQKEIASLKKADAPKKTIKKAATKEA